MCWVQSKGIFWKEAYVGFLGLIMLKRGHTQIQTDPQRERERERERELEGRYRCAQAVTKDR
jgi:hypothetical protein